MAANKRPGADIHSGFDCWPGNCETEHAGPRLKRNQPEDFSLLAGKSLEFCCTLHGKSAVAQCLSVSLVHTILM
jgi:hypothetical protein